MFAKIRRVSRKGGAAGLNNKLYVGEKAVPGKDSGQLFYDNRIEATRAKAGLRNCACTLPPASPSHKVMRITAISVLVTLAGGIAFGQSFEVASIKPSPPPDRERGMRVGASGGPGSADPGRFTTENLDLTNLITIAYGIPRYRLSAPDWLGEARFDLVAKLPDGATREQFQLMLQNLLRERFHLALHHEQKEAQAYDLTVAKNGPKLQEASDDPAPAPSPLRSPPTLGPDGFPMLPPGRAAASRTMNDKARTRFAAASMGDLAANLSSQLGRTVTDSTGLKGKYDFTLSWVRGGPDADSGPTLFGAVQEQLGLKLTSTKAPVDTLVIDHIEKTPTEN